MSISTPLIWWPWLVLRKHWEEYPTCFYSRLSALTVIRDHSHRIYTELIDLCWIGLLDKIHEIVRVEPHPLTANAYYQREICHFAQEHTRSYNKLCRLPLYFWTSCDEPRGVTRKFSWGRKLGQTIPWRGPSWPSTKCYTLVSIEFYIGLAHFEVKFAKFWWFHRKFLIFEVKFTKQDFFSHDFK